MLDEIRKKMKAFALVEAIASPDWEGRYFSYNPDWSDIEEMASFRNGSGDEWFLWLSGELAGYKCISHEEGHMTDLDDVKKRFPEEYEAFITEPAFSMDTATCIWYLVGSNWKKFGIAVKNIITLDEVLNWSATDYCEWAEDYYELDLDKACVEKLLKGEYTDDLARVVNPEIGLESLYSEISWLS